MLFILLIIFFALRRSLFFPFFGMGRSFMNMGRRPGPRFPGYGPGPRGGGFGGGPHGGFGPHGGPHGGF